MVYVEAVPEHPFTVGVTVIVAVTGIAVVLIAVNPGIFPRPFDPSPIVVFELVHAKVPPTGELIKFVPDTNPLLHTIILAGTDTVGIGFTITVTVFEPVQLDAVPVTV